MKSRVSISSPTKFYLVTSPTPCPRESLHGTVKVQIGVMKIKGQYKSFIDGEIVSKLSGAGWNG